ncbi:MAG TPA: tRNA (adenosine(37)-N6)-threonylcarbamoyltransferase complex ATPase subunit type 1 TsaE, partial [Candidatus Saccharibacteria bacterium]|nr:tRNA (adenosine(37)-N6)-threonylcarbamoyltransferase complex ATPase subunit type 1 TsaE [Candidatus Saccharibacteria bacterium]
IKGLAKGLGITEDVSSPSYTINRQYETPDGRTLSHYDFYRLVEPGIIAAEIAEDITDANTITAIEWAESVSDVLPEKRITITITSPTDSARDIVIDGVEGLK